MRYDYIDHLSEQHNLHLGKPQNLVYIDDLIDQIEEVLDNLKCIYCEKIFPDRPTLKEHMRKKIHKRINPLDTKYDKYFIINYKDNRKSGKVHVDNDEEYVDSNGEICFCGIWYKICTHFFIVQYCCFLSLFPKQ